MNNSLKLKEIYYGANPNAGWDAGVADRPKRLEYAAKQDILHLFQLEPHTGKAAIVGAAPSVKDHLDRIREIENNNGLIFPINGAHQFLIENKIIPSIQVLFEIDQDTPEEFLGGPPHKDVFYYICSHSSEKLFKAFEEYKRVLWHHYDRDWYYQDDINRLFPGEFMVSGGFVTMFRALNITLILGFRDFEFFGCDASFEGDNSHFENYHSEAKEPRMLVAAGTKENYRVFKTNPSLSFLASEFMKFCDAHQGGLTIKVHGDGMLRHLHQMEYPAQYT